MCDCADATINRAAVTAYNATVAAQRPASLGPFMACPCYSPLPPTCSNSICQMCAPTGCL